MTVDPHIVKLRFDKILSIIEELKPASEMSEEAFLDDGKTLRATERCLQIVAQAIIDVCTHLVAHNHWGAPKSYGDAVMIISRHKVIETDLADRLIDLVKLRNMIVHIYLDIDSKIVYHRVKQIISDGNLFVDSIAKLIDT
ncbi:MAG: type VII toxin-antitoxin system HepT family RNase toxin [Candidatus Thorarchaeota archaeon]